MRTARTKDAADPVHDSVSDPPVRPGLHLVVEAAGRRALLAAVHVQEIVRLVALAPRPGAPAAVAGTFPWRGVPVVAVDLAALLGVRRQPALDAQIAVLAGAPAVGLLVDRILGLRDGPAGHRGVARPEGWEATGLVRGCCEVGGEVLPLLDPGPLAAVARGEAG